MRNEQIDMKTTDNHANPIIHITHLKKAFKTNKVLTDFNLDLMRGENVAVLGKSGSGKSVLIKCLIGLLEPDEGEIKIFDDAISELNHHHLDRLRAKIGFLFQSNALYDSMTVRENLEFPLRRHWIALSKKETEELIKEVLENVGLPHTIDMMPIELSGGMRKRIALARTLILKPEIILYDEPTTGLDPITSREISELMVSIQSKYNTSSLIISHDMKCIEITADRIVILYNGICYANGTFGELKAAADQNIRQFFE